jgi:hypothetical protein
MSKNGEWDYFTKIDKETLKKTVITWQREIKISGSFRLEKSSGQLPEGAPRSVSQEVHERRSRACREKKMMMEEKATKHALPNFVHTFLTSMNENRMVWPINLLN